MSTDEMRSFCQRIIPYGLRVQVRLKDEAEVLVGRIQSVEPERLELKTDDQDVKQVRFSWIARITNA